MYLLTLPEFVAKTWNSSVPDLHFEELTHFSKILPEEIRNKSYSTPSE